MAHNRRYWTLGAVLLAVILVNAALTPGAWAQSHFKTLHAFKVSDGSAPEGSLIMDQAGNLYGTTRLGGDSLQQGTVFELRPGANGKWTEKVLHIFTGGKDGEWPVASLIMDQAGNLYGTTSAGGGVNCANQGCGTVFELTPGANGQWTESILYAFCSLSNCADGATPDASLIFDQAGTLYGTTSSGGNDGTVFELTLGANGQWTEQVLYSFSGGDGGFPMASLIFDQAGNLYGTTSVGGANNQGTAFELTPGAGGKWTEKVLHSFTGVDGGDPQASLTFDQAGNLYGTTLGGGTGTLGVTFKLSPQADGSWKEKVLHNFKGGNDGATPNPLTFDQAGNLYGTTYGGGRGFGFCKVGCGTVFKLTPNSDGGWHETVLHAFQGHPGISSAAGVIFDALGNLYGTTLGDETKFGSVFEITP